MLSQHARNGASVRRITSLRPLRACGSPAISQTSSATFVRSYVVSRHYRPQRKLGLESRPSILQERSLATAVDEYTYNSLSYGHLPPPTLPPFQISPLHSPQSFDSSSLLVIPQPLDPRPTTKVSTHGIPGDMEDLLAVFDACIRVGKLERAALVLKRLNTAGHVTPEDRILLHNRYLRASLQHLRASPDRQQAELLHKWYELQIRSQGLPHTAETIACMLKASLLSERGERLNRLVLRYMGMAPDEAGLQVLNMADILSDDDLAVITDICPTYNYTSEPESFDVEFMEGENATDVDGAVQLDPAVVPDITPTPQKGHGLTTLKMGLSLLSHLEEADVSKLTREERQQIQIQLEKDTISTAIEKWRLENKKMLQVGITTGISAGGEGSLSQVLGLWLEAMVDKLKEEFAAIETSENKTSKTERDLARCIYGPILQQSDPSRLAAVTILTVLNGGAVDGADRGIPVNKMIRNISKIVQEDIELQKRTASKKAKKQRKVTINKDASEPAEIKMSASERTKFSNIKVIDTAPEPERKVDSSFQEWSMQIRAQVGSILLKLLMETARIKATIRHPMTGEKVSQYQPAFSHVFQPRRGRKVGLVCLNSHLVDKLRREPVGDYIAKHLPMLVEPMPWKSFNRGGLLISKTKLVRMREADAEQKLYTEAAMKRGDMKQVLQGLDVLGKTAWKINKKTLDVMIEAWNSGDSVANFPALNPQLETPPEPDSSADPLVRTAWARAVKAVEHERSGLHSERCFMNLQLEIARALRNQTIYFPHNIDYRGRAYPIPTYLNHMGADHTRAILKFAHGKELGARGLRWLKIHLANVYGLDKASFDDREAFANENIERIRETAANPLKGSRWWLEAEDPWQFLSTCFELAEAYELPDPTKFVSSLPVHQDGTCNGLQHYAALGGDTWGAKQVNLEPGEKPADVYTAVADLVKAEIDKDAANDDPFGKALTGKITRKVVKQTVMTNVYGVTFAGAKKQVCKQIDAIYPDLHKQCGIPHILLSTYIARHIFNALASMFRGAHDIQDWLNQVSGRVCRAVTPSQIKHIEKQQQERGAGEKTSRAMKAGMEELAAQFRSTVIWTTPLRMPVVQPYRKSTMKEIRTCMQGFTYPAGDQTDPVNRKKQLQGFPPNFIHSLDASHMLLSAVSCHERGLAFAAVHDSFWTHAADIDVMNECLRDAFISIHEEDVIGRLASEFETRHQGSLYLAKIDADSPVGQKIRELRANSKLSPREELLLEHQRQSLKRSGNPWDLEAAKQIVTPASVYEDMVGNEEDVMINEDAKDLPVLGEFSEADADLKNAVSELDMSEHHSEDVDGSEIDQDSPSYSTLAIASIQRSAFETQMFTPKQVGKYKRAALPVWLPLTIPAIPKKGDFDVSRLRGSKYFFS